MPGLSLANLISALIIFIGGIISLWGDKTEWRGRKTSILMVIVLTVSLCFTVYSNHENEKDQKKLQAKIDKISMDNAILRDALEKTNVQIDSIKKDNNSLMALINSAENKLGEKIFNGFKDGQNSLNEINNNIKDYFREKSGAIAPDIPFASKSSIVPAQKPLDAKSERTKTVEPKPIYNKDDISTCYIKEFNEDDRRYDQKTKECLESIVKSLKESNGSESEIISVNKKIDDVIKRIDIRRNEDRKQSENNPNRPKSPLVL